MRNLMDKDKITKDVYKTDLCYGIRIETQDTKKGKHRPFIGKYCGIKKKYIISIITED